MECKMKKLFVFLLLSLCTVIASAQDVIIKKDGSTIICRIIEVTSSEIVYKKWTDLKGANYVMNRADASAINYESGKKDSFSEAINQYTPNIQNDGTHQYNDNVLLQIDAESRGVSTKKVKTLRLVGLIGGAVLVGTGAVMIFAGEGEKRLDTNPAMVAGVVMTGCGLVGATVLCIMANHYQKYNRLQTSSIFQQDFKLKNGTVLTPSIDMYDMSLNSRGLGVGLSYNF